jgi:protein phosphatase
MKDESGKPLRAGTTLCAVYIREGKMNWLSVGDSKIYIFKGGKFICLTNEHNYMYLANMNKDNENFKIDPNARHDALVSFIGAKNLMYIDINDEPLELEDGDVIILCSDGLYKSLHEEDIVLQLFKEENDMQIVVENMISEVMKKANGTQDNTTVVVMKYKNE